MDKYVVKYSITVPLLGEPYFAGDIGRPIFTRVVEATSFEDLCHKITNFEAYQFTACKCNLDLKIHKIEKLEDFEKSEISENITNLNTKSLFYN